MAGHEDSKSSPIISLLTDFGLMDPYVAEMKAVILSTCPKAAIIDISHLVEKFNIRMGAFLLASAAPSFPAGSVHVAVVDPGVGSERRPIVIEARRNLYVGPDNGLLIPAAEAEGILKVFEVANHKLMRSDVSATFHGRDIFAPVAAHLACGVQSRECGPEISHYVKPPYTQPTLDGRKAFCEVFHIDGFGNIITNLRSTHISKWNLSADQKFRISLGNRRISARCVRTYSDLKKNEFGFLTGSHGFVEIACREENAAKRIRAKTGIAVRIEGA